MHSYLLDPKMNIRHKSGVTSRLHYGSHLLHLRRERITDESWVQETEFNEDLRKRYMSAMGLTRSNLATGLQITMRVAISMDACTRV